MANPQRVGGDLPDWAPVRKLPTRDEALQRAEVRGCGALVGTVLLVLAAMVVFCL